MDNKKTLINQNPSVLSGFGATPDPYTQQKEAEDAAAKLGFIWKVDAGVNSMGLVVEGKRLFNQAVNTFDGEATDNTFVKGIQERIAYDMPDANDNEAAYLANARNKNEYAGLVNELQKVRADRKTVDNSGIALTTRIIGDVIPELLIAHKISGSAVSAVSKAGRMAIGVGGNAAAGAGYEYQRQKMALEEQDNAAVMLVGVASGAFGAYFDGLSAATRQKHGKTIKGVFSKALGSRPVVTGVADAAPEVASVAPQAAGAGQVFGARRADDSFVGDMQPKAAKAADAGVPGAPAVKAADETLPSIKSFIDEIDAGKAEGVASARELLEATGSAETKAFRDSVESATKEADALKVVDGPMAPLAGEVGPSIDDVVEPLVKSDVVTAEAVAKAPDAVTVGVTDGAKPLVTEAAPVVAKVPRVRKPEVLTPEIAAVEDGAHVSLTSGKLVVSDGDHTFRPIFKSPVDRAMAVVGSRSTDEVMHAGAMKILQKAYPELTTDNLVRLASDYVDDKLMPTLKSSDRVSPTMPRHWNTVDAQKYLHVEVEKMLTPEAIAEFGATTEVKAADMVVHESDVGGVLRDEAVAVANKMVVEDVAVVADVAPEAAEVTPKVDTLPRGKTDTNGDTAVLADLGKTLKTFTDKAPELGNYVNAIETKDIKALKWNIAYREAELNQAIEYRRQNPFKPDATALDISLGTQATRFPEELLARLRSALNEAQGGAPVADVKPKTPRKPKVQPSVEPGLVGMEKTVDTMAQVIKAETGVDATVLELRDVAAKEAYARKVFDKEAADAAALNPDAVAGTLPRGKTPSGTKFSPAITAKTLGYDIESATRFLKEYGSEGVVKLRKLTEDYATLGRETGWKTSDKLTELDDAAKALKAKLKGDMDALLAKPKVADNAVAKPKRTVKPKAAYVAAGVAVGAIVLSTNASAADGSQAVNAGVKFLIEGSLLLLGGIAAHRVIAGKGMNAIMFRKKMAMAEKMLAEKVPAEEILAKTDVHLVINPVTKAEELMLSVKATDFPELENMTADEASAFLEATHIKIPSGQMTSGVPVFSEMMDAAAAKFETLGNSRYDSLLFGGRVRRKVFSGEMETLMADSMRLEDDTDAFTRGIGRYFAAAQNTLESKEAARLSADVVYKEMHVASLGAVQEALNTSRKAWYEETGLKKPAMTNLKQLKADAKLFHEEVARAKEFPNDTTVSQAAKDVAGKIAVVEAEAIKMAELTVKQMKAKGFSVSDDSPLGKLARLPPDPHYVSRMINNEQWVEIEAKIGQKGVLKLIGGGFAAANRLVPADKIEGIAESIYVALTRSKDRIGMFATPDVIGDLDKALRANGLDEATIAFIKYTHGLQADGVVPGVLQSRRFATDLSHSADFVVGGETINVRLDSLYERDISKLFGRWSHSVAGINAIGTIGLQAGVDFTDDAVWRYAVERMTRQGGKETNITMLNAYRDLILGRTKNVAIFGQAGDIERTIRGMSNFWLGENFFMAQAGDVGGMGARGVGMLLKSAPALLEMRKAIAGGAMTNQELKAVASMLNLGADSVSASIYQIGEGVGDSAASFADNLVQQQSRLNGMTMVTNATKLVKSHEMLIDLLAHADGELVDPRRWTHYSAYGLDEATATRMGELLRDPKIVLRDADGVLAGIDKQAFMAKDMELYRVLQNSMHRAGNAANSTASGWGETAQFFRASAAGRFIGQLQSTASFITYRTFKEAKNFDGLIAQAWVMSFSFAAASYMARTALRYGGDQEEMDKRLSNQQIFMGGLRQASFMGIWPNIVDAAVGVVGMDPIFANQTASGRAGGGELAAQAAVKTPLRALGGLFGLLNPDPTDRFTQAEAYALKRTLAPIWWLTPLMTLATEDLATKNDKKPPEEAK